ncbi:hypothetical protein CAPTEDRAFT_203582 [Capitella teleta]|uniref:Uncharacterized protein n=1 Tax=Capitella teleta TaxID=283909 RepID=R7UCU6_CAPTE|nr:hypothetical protein CAPTEDRAFT_203582 [Capitella teleta]|eukprot:ELU04210.1 hypothetical protein CAPTEDRAFT_203582 [Capitella teleta]
MEGLLEKIVENTEPKGSMQFVVSSDKTQFRTRFNPPIQFNKKKKYEMALVNLETYYSFPNIDSTNNHFRYSPDSGATWFDILLEEESYDIIDINVIIQDKMRGNGHYDEINNAYYISLFANENTLKSILIIDGDYQIDFRPTNSISSLLGFNNEVFMPGSHDSTKVVNILAVNSILVNVDVISGSYVNGVSMNTIYSFFPNVSPGYKIVETPVNLVYLPITLDTIYSLESKVTDQDGKLLNLRAQINKLTKAYQQGKGATIKMSKTKVAQNLKVEGGFLGALAGMAARFLPMIAKTVLPALGVGALSGLASTGIQKAMGSGLYLKKGGCVCQVETDGKGLYLGQTTGSGLESMGDGLYLKKDGGMYVVSEPDPTGRGLILGANSPFKNIPVLGWIL